MLGNMMNGQLLISGLIEHAEKYHSDVEIVSRSVEGHIHRYTYTDAAKRSRKLANALTKLGLKEGDTVGTLAWNTFRHFELYFGVSGIGCVVNTVNPRLFPEQLTYIINHAENQYLFIDLSFVELVESLQGELKGVKGFVILTDRENMPDTKLANTICYEELISDESEDFQWPEFDENTASSLCYTSGTTGNPKGVLYSHRSTILHAWIVSSGNVAKVSSSSCILPVVPMFHVNAWGIPYAGAMFGAKLVFPGPALDGASLFELIDNEKPDLLMGVPTVWLGLLQHLRETNQTLDCVETALVGGSAAPRAMIQEFEEEHDVFLMHGWGMTEMSPLGTATSRTKEMDNLDLEKRYDLQQKQGKAFFGVDMTIADDEGNELPHDGIAFGRLLVKGPTIVERYYKSNESAVDDKGWFDTGDVAKIHPEGYMEIVDRSKDVIKSGGEWISSIDLENAAVGHPGIAEACVIGVLHTKWDERPLLLVVRAPNQEPSKEEINAFLEDKVAKWWLPDDIVFVEELPHTATGKLLKTGLREDYKNHLIKKLGEIMIGLVPAEKLEDYVGQDIGSSEWFEVDQDRIDMFADATLDHQFIHVDEEKATPLFGSTIAHGFLSLSLIPHLTSQAVLAPENLKMVFNYGLDKVRFINPVNVGCKVRTHSKCVSVEDKGDGRYLMKTEVSMEIEGVEKPAYIS